MEIVTLIEGRRAEDVLIGSTHEEVVVGQQLVRQGKRWRQPSHIPRALPVLGIIQIERIEQTTQHCQPTVMKLGRCRLEHRMTVGTATYRPGGGTVQIVEAVVC